MLVQLIVEVVQVAQVLRLLPHSPRTSRIPAQIHKEVAYIGVKFRLVVTSLSNHRNQVHQLALLVHLLLLYQSLEVLNKVIPTRQLSSEDCL